MDDTVAGGECEMRPLICTGLFKILQPEQLFPCEQMKAMSGLREYHAPPAATHQFYAEEFLQLLDLPTK